MSLTSQPVYWFTSDRDSAASVQSVVMPEQ
jgi:hypothetical protein